MSPFKFELGSIISMIRNTFLQNLLMYFIDLKYEVRFRVLFGFWVHLKSVHA